MLRIFVPVGSLIFLASFDSSAAGGDARKNSAVTNPSHDTSPAVIGTTEELFKSFDLRNLRSNSRLRFPISMDSSLDVEISSRLHEDDYIVLRGTVESSGNSTFLLKGTENELYGSIVLKDKNLAYEYTTNSQGEVIVEKVAVEKIFPVCNLAHVGWANPAKGHPLAKRKRGPEPHIGPYDGSDVRKLQSLPGAKKVYYMDITRVMNGDTPKYYSKEQMWDAWQATASSFSMYEVNVTTDADVYAAASVKDSGIARFLDQDGRSNAQLHSFGTATYSNIYKYKTGDEQGRTVAHEAGHQLGLLHDGGGKEGEYFEGIPEFKWVPIMGNFWRANPWKDDSLVQFSLGEYNTATKKEDDFKIMGRYLELRTDDIPDTTELIIADDGTVSPEENRGQIAARADTDSFSFSIKSANGHAKLKIDRTEYIMGAMLDIDASIVDESGMEVANSNPKAARHAEFDVDLEPGKYTLAIKGGAEGTPQHGFSDYSSMGFYAIEGKIDGAASDEEAPTTSITSPKEGDEIILGTDFEVIVDATDNDAVEVVELFVDGNSIGTSQDEPYTFTVETTSLSAGPISIRAVASDAAMNEGDDTIEVTLIEDGDDDDDDDDDTSDDDDDDDDDDTSDDDDDDDDTSDDDDDDDTSDDDDDDNNSSDDDDDDDDNSENEDNSSTPSKNSPSSNDDGSSCSISSPIESPPAVLALFGLVFTRLQRRRKRF